MVSSLAMGRGEDEGVWPQPSTDSDKSVIKTSDNPQAQTGPVGAKKVIGVRMHSRTAEESMRAGERRHRGFKPRVPASSAAAPDERMFEKRNREACCNALWGELSRVRAVLERLNEAAPVKVSAGS